jgi:hypothetical protein
MRTESDRKLLTSAIRNQTNSTSGQLGRQVPAANRPAPSDKEPTSLSTIPAPGLTRDFYRSVVDDFWISTCDPVKRLTRRATQATMSICAQAILPLAFRNKALDAALFAVSTMYLGRLRDDAKLRRLAMGSYPTALSLCRSELVLAFDSKAEGRSQKDLVMAIVLSLLLFEVNSP